MCWIHRRLGAAPTQLGLTVLMLSLASAGSPAFAAPAEQPPAKAENKKVIEEMVVSARAEAESIRTIPAAVTAISEQKLQDFGLTSMMELQQMTPQLRIDRASSGSGASISIRGLGSTSLSIGIEQSVPVIIDGVYYAQGRSINEGLNDVSNVAILKGPQALYFGKNATAGVLSINTNNPRQEREAMVKISEETHSKERKINVVLSGGVTDWLALRLAVQDSSMSQGDYKNSGLATTYTTIDQNEVRHTYAAPRARKWWPQEKTRFVRLTGAGDINEHLSYNAKLNYGQYTANSSTGGGERLRCYPQNAASITGTDDCKLDFRRGINDIPPEVAASNPLLSFFGSTHAAGEQFTSRGGTFTGNYNADKFDVRAVYNHQYQTDHWVGDQDGGALVSIFAGENNKFTNDSLELRAVSHLDFPVNFVIGTYLQKTKREWHQVVNFLGVEDNSPAVRLEDRFTAYNKVSETKGKTASVYGEVIWDITDTLQLDGGLRYIHENKDSFFFQPYVAPYSRIFRLPNGTQVGAFPFQAVFTQYNPADPNTIAKADQTFKKAVPEVTLRWRPEENLMVYAAFKKGYKSGGFSNSSILSNATTRGNGGDPAKSFVFKPETVRGGEIGTKVQFFDDSVSLSAEVYYYKFVDLQVEYFRSDLFAYTALNAGGSITKGAEVQADWATPLEGLRVSGSLGYLKSYYTAFKSFCYTGQSTSAGCIFANAQQVASGQPEQDLKGNTRPGAPKLSGFLEVRYESPTFFNLVGGFAVNMQFKTATQLSGIDPTLKQSGYKTYDANIHLRTTDDKWAVALIARNVFNSKAILGVGGVPGTGGGTGTANGFPSDQVGASIRPRRFQLEGTWRL